VTTAAVAEVSTVIAAASVIGIAGVSQTAARVATTAAAQKAVGSAIARASETAVRAATTAAAQKAVGSAIDRARIGATPPRARPCWTRRRWRRGRERIDRPAGMTVASVAASATAAAVAIAVRAGSMIGRDA
jgi:hypothetical protein